MSKEEMLQENNLIAEFMGNKIVYDGISHHFYYKNSDGIPRVKQTRNLYNSSWDWLMPVVEKIQKLGYVCVIYGNYCNIIERDLFTKKYDGEGFNIDYYSESIDNVIEAVHKCVIEFIEWYNKNKLNEAN